MGFGTKGLFATESQRHREKLRKGVASAAPFSADVTRTPNFSHIFLSIPQANLIVHSFCTKPKRFSIAARNILPQSGFTENVGTLNACRTTDCGDAGGSWRFSRVNCQGKSEMRVSACWLPGHCGLLHFPLFERVGPLATAGVAESDSLNRGYAASTGKSGTPSGALSDRYRRLAAPKRREGKLRDPRTMRFGWLARAAFVFPP
jgi:hypothetical protein